jgi:hypothetical protein
LELAREVIVGVDVGMALQPQNRKHNRHIHTQAHHTQRSSAIAADHEQDVQKIQPTSARIIRAIA